MTYIEAIYILIAAVAGGLVTLLTTRVLERRSRFVIERNDEEFEQGQNLPIGADLRILHGQRDITNFRISRFSVKNESARDFDNVKIRIWSGPDRFILHDTIHKSGSMDIIPYHPEFMAFLGPDELGGYTEDQSRRYDAQREYSIPIFSRFEIVEIVIVSTVQSETSSNVWIEIPHKGIRAEQKYHRTFLLGVPNDEVWPYTIAFMIISILLPAILLQNPWMVALIAGIGSAFSVYPAAAVYRAKKRLLKMLAD